jgi:hypothetical protein
MNMRLVYYRIDYSIERTPLLAWRQNVIQPT